MDCRDRAWAVGRAMPVSINLWVPARGESRDSCNHYKLVSHLEGHWRGPWGEVMKFELGLVFRDSSSLLSTPVGTTAL